MTGFEHSHYHNVMLLKCLLDTNLRASLGNMYNIKLVPQFSRKHEDTDTLLLT